MDTHRQISTQTLRKPDRHLREWQIRSFCPSNDLSQCKGNDASAVSIIPSGTVSGANVTTTISFPSTSASDTVTMVGTATGTNLAGTYTDNLGDSGTWTSSTAIYPFG